MIKYQAYSENLYFSDLEPTYFKNGEQYYRANIYIDHGQGLFSKTFDTAICPSKYATWIDKYGEVSYETLIQ